MGLVFFYQPLQSTPIATNIMHHITLVMDSISPQEIPFEERLRLSCGKRHFYFVSVVVRFRIFGKTLSMPPWLIL